MSVWIAAYVSPAPPHLNRSWFCYFHRFVGKKSNKSQIFRIILWCARGFTHTSGSSYHAKQSSNCLNPGSLGQKVEIKRANICNTGSETRSMISYHFSSTMNGLCKGFLSAAAPTQNRPLYREHTDPIPLKHVERTAFTETCSKGWKVPKGCFLSGFFFFLQNKRKVFRNGHLPVHLTFDINL